MALDLNLYRVFEAIYSEGSLTGAGRVLHKTQPALSYSLARLRETLDDPLFVRQGRRLQPTAKARQMIGEVREALRRLERLSAPSGSFDPAKAKLDFRLGLRDVLEATILPELAALLRQEAPAVSLSALQVPRREMAARLADGSLDLAIDVRLDVAASIRMAPLFEDALVIVAAAGREMPKDLDSYLCSPHLLVSSRQQGPGVEDMGLRRLGVERKINLRCQHYFAGCRTAAQTDLLLTMPETYARTLMDQVPGLQLAALPVSLPPVMVQLYWHERREVDPANQWLRARILERARSVQAQVHHPLSKPMSSAGGSPS